MTNRIEKALSKLFNQHRIIFWYDAKRELRPDFEALQLSDVEKIELRNNEFGTKHRILREQPDGKFLLYHEGPQPESLDNWLFDVQLAQGEFRTDQVGIWLGELELGLEFANVVQDHVFFFNAEKRRDALKSILKVDDTPNMLRMKMLAVCASSEVRIDDILENLLVELAEKQQDKTKLIERCGLDEFLFEQLKRCYGYLSDTPGIQDFAVALFKSCWTDGTGGTPELKDDALVFLKRWKDSRRYGSSFESLSDEYAKILNIEQDLATREYRKLIDLDYFSLIDRKILSGLVKDIADRTISAGDCANIVRQRRQSHWYNEFRHLYEAAEYASQLIHRLDKIDLKVKSMPDAVRRYADSWHIFDQLYRKFIYHVRESGQTSLMAKLSEQVENLYTNNYLFKVNNNWQQVVDGLEKWDTLEIGLQRRFFHSKISPILDKNKKVFVIISDALRFEIGAELLRLIRQEDRYGAEIEPMLSMLPSYTQLGMAALLPNHELSLAEDTTGAVFVNGQSSQGIANRKKILNNSLSQPATAIRADDLLSLNKQACRELIRDHDLVFVYHNRIDAVGDKRESEERVFEAVEEALQELIKIIKKLTAANANNLLVTADHGFIYQNRAIDESDYSPAEVSGGTILFRDRRFILGKDLTDHPGLKKFTAAQLGLQNNMEVQIPKSIHRLRLKGSGSRYVHGGASLQEIIVPVIQINKKRQSDIKMVGVDILRGDSSIITSGQLAVAFYQAQTASDKIQPRRLRAGIYTQEGELISDRHDLLFDFKSENPREREMKVRFVLTRKAEQANNQEVVMRLEEQLSGTSHYQEYKSVRYLMRRSFTSDFDF